MRKAMRGYRSPAAPCALSQGAQRRRACESDAAGEVARASVAASAGTATTSQRHQSRQGRQNWGLAGGAGVAGADPRLARCGRRDIRTESGTRTRTRARKNHWPKPAPRGSARTADAATPAHPIQPCPNSAPPNRARLKLSRTTGLGFAAHGTRAIRAPRIGSDPRQAARTGAGNGPGQHHFIADCLNRNRSPLRLRRQRPAPASAVPSLMGVPEPESFPGSSTTPGPAPLSRR
jgi:hypothetical protein